MLGDGLEAGSLPRFRILEPTATSSLPANSIRSAFGAARPGFECWARGEDGGRAGPVGQNRPVKCDASDWHTTNGGARVAVE
jgi:hypothetical protein